ncbi:hypothetical protein [Nocardia wallacei]|uniref:hypothetical protein n=1 Tax=Nocardia wallacei TaxID=480035 RepID=UPI0024565FBE|nr:hypothetical protein [Nocardia wallacei]
MPVQPYPYVILDGALMDTDLTHFGTKPVVLDGISLDWGRSEYLSHAETATLTISFVDRTGTLAQKVTGRRMIGAPLAVFYTDAPGSPWGACWFQGRVNAATAHPSTRDPFSDDPKAKAWTVTLTAADKTADLGQIVQPPGNWPQENAQQRAVRIRDGSAIAGIGQFYFYPGHTGSLMWEIDVKGRDNLALVKDFYMSMGDTFSYLPKENNIRYLHRRAYDMHVSLIRDDDGVIRARAADYTFDNRLYRGIGIQSCEVTAADSTTVPTQSTITRVETSWKDIPNGGRDWVTVVWDDTLPEHNWGRRTLTLTSWLGDGRQIDPVTLELLNRGRFEGSIPRHPDITVDTRRTGGFHSKGEAEAFLEGGETQGVAYVSGSQHAQWQFITPVYAIIGGTITYRHPGWVITCRLQACWRTNLATPPTWTGMAAAITWGPPGHGGNLSESLTWFDMTFLDNGTVYESEP